MAPIRIYTQDVINHTNRQLLSGFRSELEHLKDVRECLNKGWKLYLGENILPVYRAAKHNCNVLSSQVAVRYGRKKVMDIETSIFGTQND